MEQETQIIEAFKIYHPKAEFATKTEYDNSIKFDFNYTTKDKCIIHKRSHKSNRNYVMFFPNKIKLFINVTTMIVQKSYY